MLNLLHSLSLSYWLRFIDFFFLKHQTENLQELALGQKEAPLPICTPHHAAALS